MPVIRQEGLVRQTEDAPEGTIAGRYSKLEAQRQPYLERGYEASELTIPGLLPRAGHTGASRLYQPFQSLGARGVNNLASKLLLVLFPPGTTFFRLALEPGMRRELEAVVAGEGADDVFTEMESALQKQEALITSKMDQTGARRPLYEALKHLVVTGNYLLQVNRDGTIKGHRLDSYVVKRDLEGNPIEIITREGLSAMTLPDRIREEVGRVDGVDRELSDGRDTLWLYTRVWLKGSGNQARWHHVQEFQGVSLESTRGVLPKGASMLIPLRWFAVDGEDYGRGHVEENIGDLRSFDALSQAIIELAAAASKILWLVDEAGTTSKKDLERASSGSIVDGNARDVSTLQMQKFPDFQVTLATAQEVQGRLRESFLLNSIRNAERVTAEEIRLLANELETALGGVYSTLAQELQRPLVVRLISVMTRAGELPTLPEGSVRPEIITGLEGLGRSSDLQKLDILLAGFGTTFGSEAVAEYVSPGAYAQRRATAIGLDIEGLIRPEEEVQAARQQRMMAEMAGRMGPAAIQQIGQTVRAGVKGNQEAGTEETT